MTSLASNIPGRGVFPRGVHPEEGKEYSASAAIEVLPNPKSLRIPLHQHTGAPCHAVVKTKQEVARGELLADTEAFVSAPIHAPLSGTVGKETVATLANGRHVQALPLSVGEGDPAGEALREELLGGEWPADGLAGRDASAACEAIRRAGLVGMGGAAFPTHVKLTRNPERPVDVLLVNGCECEPYLTADYRMMLEAPAAVVAGARIAAEICGARQTYIAVENNKLDGAESLNAAAAGTDIRTAVVHTKYPMGGERQTIQSVLGREVPTGGLPLDVGVVVINVSTAAAVAAAVQRERPLTHRVVSVTGPGVVRPTNVLAPIGASLGELIDFAGGLTGDTERVVAGGPMMGFAVGSLDTPVTKGTSGVLALTAGELGEARETSCVRCGRCVDVCPLHLVPTKMALAARHKDWELARRYQITACCECGCCAYTCPAAIPLTQLIRMGKAQMPRD